MGDDPARLLLITIDRLALELAHERADHAATREALDSARRQARTWRRVAQWIFHSRQPKGGQDAEALRQDHA